MLVKGGVVETTGSVANVRFRARGLEGIRMGGLGHENPPLESLIIQELP